MGMFKASALEFRLRYWLHAVVYGLGFWAPWNYALHLDPAGASGNTWGILAANISRAGWLPYLQASVVLLCLAIALALAAAMLRTWGGAYLGAAVVQDGGMHAVNSPTPFAGAPVSGVTTDGPYRRMRNPLYLGTFLHTLALAILMPRTGAIFAIVLIGIMQVRLILGEEAFLTRTVGLPYEAYCKLVPRVLPALRARVAAGGRAARWGQAVLGETYMWLAAFAFCFAGWGYNAAPLIQYVIVAFGISLLVRAFSPKVAG